MDLYQDMAALSADGTPFVAVTVVQSAGSTPGKPGARLLVLEDGSLRGTIGGGAIEQQAVDAARALLVAPGGASTRLMETHLTHELGMCCGGRMTLFLERVGRPDTLTLFGAGHVAAELAALASRVGFRVTVVDARAEWASEARFPSAERVLLQDPADHARGLKGGAAHYFVVTTHDHPLDQAVVEALLPKPSAYLGVIGSRRKAARFRQRLEAAGFTGDQIARMRSPMGLEIQAVTPAEIAVSVVGELIMVRRQQAAMVANLPVVVRTTG